MDRRKFLGIGSAVVAVTAVPAIADQLYVPGKPRAPDQWQERISGETVDFYKLTNLDFDRDADSTKYIIRWYSGKNRPKYALGCRFTREVLAERGDKALDVLRANMKQTIGWVRYGRPTTGPAAPIQVEGACCCMINYYE